MEEQSESLVEIQNLNICQEGKVILENVSFEIGIGEFAYIIGKVGSGKSSFIKTLYCELPAIPANNDFVAKVAGMNLYKIKSKKLPMLRRKVGMIFQDLQLLQDRSVYENLKFVLKATGWKNKNDIKIRIEQVLRSVNMLDKINAMPSKLSGGEQQSISIARAILNNPPLIFADEPTGNLDPESADTIMDILHKMKDEGRTVIMVTHNYNLLKKFPGKTFMCENKKMFEVKDQSFEIE